MSRLKVLSLNVRGLGSSKKSCQIVHELSFAKCDVALLQETHVSGKSRLTDLKNIGVASVFGLLVPVDLLVLPSFSLRISVVKLSVFYLIQMVGF